MIWFVKVFMYTNNHHKEQDMQQVFKIVYLTRGCEAKEVHIPAGSEYAAMKAAAAIPGYDIRLSCELSD